MRRDTLIQELLKSPEPSIRWRTRVHVLGESPKTAKVRQLGREIRDSARARGLLSERNMLGRPGTVRRVYYKWQGIHWTLLSLADLGYPARDPTLGPLLDRSLDQWLGAAYDRSFTATTESQAYGGDGVPVVNGRARRCASQQGAALYYATKLGTRDPRQRRLTELLLRWQWPDGGWNCDRTPSADTSSFMETLWPMRGLAAYAAASDDDEARAGAHRASEVFLERRMFRRRSNGATIHPDFVTLHYPLYWHYDVLGGLKGLAEAGSVGDPRCAEGLDWLEKKELPSGGWPAEKRYYQVASTFRSSSEFVSWGPTGKRRRNDWVTTDALYVLRSAGRLAT